MFFWLVGGYLDVLRDVSADFGVAHVAHRHLLAQREHCGGQTLDHAVVGVRALLLLARSAAAFEELVQAQRGLQA